jgi:hypothetical protein
MSGIKSIPMAINPMEIVIGIVDLTDGYYECDACFG